MRSGSEHDKHVAARLTKSYDVLQKWPGRSGEVPRGARELVLAWEEVGLNAEGLYLHLMEAVDARSDYETFRREVAAQMPIGKREKRRLRTVVNAGEPMVEAINTSRIAIEGMPADQLAAAVALWAKEYVTGLESRGQRKLSRGRPGEPWLKKQAVHLAEQLRRVG